MTLLNGFEHIVRQNVPLAPYTKLDIGGPAEYFAEPTSQEELVALVKRFADSDFGIRLIGSGTNLIVDDQGVSGLVIHLSAPVFGEIKVTENGLIAGGGAKLANFVSTAVREGFAGPEHMVGLPGTIGGALHNYSDAHGIDLATWFRSAEVLTRSGEVARRDAEAMSFSYGNSSLSELAILSVEFEFERGDVEKLSKSMQKLWIVRRKDATLEKKSAYMFQDQGSETASSLIDQAGIKGTAFGNVALLETDPNFFVCEPGATSSDINQLIDYVKQQVHEKLDVELTPAIQIW